MTEERMSGPVTASITIGNAADLHDSSDPNTLISLTDNNIIIEDETWIHRYEPETKQHALETCRLTSSKKFESQHSGLRSPPMTPLWNSQVHIHQRFFVFIRVLVPGKK